MTAFLFHYPF